MRDLAARFPGRVAVRIGYDEALSHRLFAGARCGAGASAGSSPAG